MTQETQDGRRRNGTGETATTVDTVVNANQGGQKDAAGAKPAASRRPRSRRPAAKKPAPAKTEGKETVVATAAAGNEAASQPAEQQPARKAPARRRRKPSAQAAAANKPETAEVVKAAVKAPAKPKQARGKRPNNANKVQNSGKKLKVVFLGGIEEIGKNMTALEYEDDIIVIDCGLTFPDEEMLGIDVVIPDMTYLEKNRSKLRGLVITHGHEDHIGASPYFLKNFKVPVYATQLTLGIVGHKLQEKRINDAKLNVITAGDRVQIGAFNVEFIRVTHSISGAVALGIRTPVGTVVHTGDFKVDFTPPSGEVTDFAAFSRLSDEGVMLLMAESTNIERHGYTMSEKMVGETFDEYISKAQGRVFVATFASNVHRIQQIIDVAIKYGRKVCLSGRSMINIGNIAMELGIMKIPAGFLVDLDRVNTVPDKDLVVITTGSQGEPMSGLVRMAANSHNKLEIHPGDMVIISANPIPGNEKFVSRVIDQLYRRGAQVIYEALADVHVSGHACREELKLIHTLVKPKYFIPVHGEYRHMVQHKKMAEELGMAPENALLPSLGGVVEFYGDGSVAYGGSVPSGSVLVDGLGVGDVGSVVLRDRKLLSQDGLLIATMAISRSEMAIVSGPEIISRGFVYVRESEDLIDEATGVVQQTVEDHLGNGQLEHNALKNAVRNTLRSYLFQKTRRSPVILPVVMEVD